MTKFPLMAASVAALLVAGPVLAADTAMTDMRANMMMTTAAGMSLYTFDKDAVGVSNCDGDCAVEWPPMLASANATVPENFGTIKRSDGSMQWAWMGKPLYMFDEDKVAGDMKGAGYSPDWHLAIAAQ